jgi:hypothetical protein
MCVSGFRLAELAARFALYPSLCRSEPVPEPGQRIPEDQKTKANHLRNLYPRWRPKAVIGDADQAKDKAEKHEKNPEPIALPSRTRLLISLLRQPYCPHSSFILRVWSEIPQSNLGKPPDSIRARDIALLLCTPAINGGQEMLVTSHEYRNAYSCCGWPARPTLPGCRAFSPFLRHNRRSFRLDVMLNC